MIYELNKDFTLTYTVKKIISRASSGRYIIDIKVVKFEGYPKKTCFPREMVAFGAFGTINVNDTFKSTACFIENPTRGYCFNLKGTPTRIFPSTEKEVSKYLSSHINGLGKKTADDIARIVGPSAITKIPAHPECLDAVPGLKGKKKAHIIAWCQDNIYCEQVMLYMMQHGVPLEFARSLYDKFGKLAIAKLQENPYAIYESGTISFRYAEKIASNLQFPWNHENRLLCAIRAAIDDRIDSHGDTCILESQIMSVSERYLKRSSFYDATVDCYQPGVVFPGNRYKRAIQTLTEAGELIPYTRVENGKQQKYYYRKKTFHAETNAAEKVIGMVHGKPVIQSTKNQITKYLTATHPDLAAEQIGGVIMAATHKFSVLTGGPGTGKTYTMKALIDTLQHFRSAIKIVQAAPTAKAAAKMREATGMDADTLHATFHMTAVDYGQENKFILDADYLIIDESSMIGIELFADILSHISDKTCILMVGDPAQLPSISCGTVLQSLCESGTVPVTELSVIHRQSQNSTIVTNAHLIRSGDPKQLKKLEKYNSRTKEHADFVFFNRKNEDEIAQSVVDIVEKLVTKHKVPVEQIMVLTPVHVTACGTDVLNSMLQGLLNPTSDDAPQCAVSELKVFHKGDRVMNTRNFKLKRKDRPPVKVKNGDIGYVVGIGDADSSVDVQFDNSDEVITFKKGNLENLELAYAMTVHKSQGSEAECVVMPFVDNAKHKGMLNRSLIYTALTRAKTHFYGVGVWDVFVRGCADNNQNYSPDDAVDSKRLSLFTQFLQGKNG